MRLIIDKDEYSLLSGARNETKHSGTFLPFHFGVSERDDWFAVQSLQTLFFFFIISLILKV